jgi:hypothetical protein
MSCHQLKGKEEKKIELKLAKKSRILLRFQIFQA